RQLRRQRPAVSGWHRHCPGSWVVSEFSLLRLEDGGIGGLAGGILNSQPHRAPAAHGHPTGKKQNRLPQMESTYTVTSVETALLREIVSAAPVEPSCAADKNQPGQILSGLMIGKR